MSDGGKLEATGIEYDPLQDGEQRRVLVNTRKIILCAGMFESHAILEGACIGSKAVLAAANVPLLYEDEMGWRIECCVGFLFFFYFFLNDGGRMDVVTWCM